MAIIIIFGIVMLAIGFWAMRVGKNTTEDYFVSSRSFGTFVALWALLATYYSQWYTFAYPGFMYSSGIGALVELPGGIMVYTLTFYYIGRKVRFMGERYGYQTIADLMVGRYEGSLVRSVVGILSLLICFPYVVAGLMAMGRIIEMLSNGILTYTLSTIVALIIILVYTYMGGMRAVSWTNVVQGILITVAMLLVLYYLFTDAISLKDAFLSLLEKDPEWLSYPGPIGYIPYSYRFSYIWGFVLGGLLLPFYFVRFFTPKSDQVIKNMLKLFVIGSAFICTTVFLVAIVGRAVMPGLSYGESENIILLLVQQYTPAWLFILVSVGILAAIMSTADAVFLATSMTISRDFLQGLINPKASDSIIFWSGRFGVVFVGLVGLYFAINPFAIIFTLHFLAWTLALQLLPAVIFAFYWPRATRVGILSGIIVGVVVNLLSSFVWKLDFTWAGVPALLANIVVSIIVSLATEPSSKEIQDKFYGYIESKLY